ncbi:maleylacetate reductase [Paraburkholderia steynii]|uniref:maleylacetate reductase n=1 Tax=Paraburkholderia steynii TaxID=1245441 RepID=A0A7Z7FJC4_9BURK|nr:maleylacetate reductase [Paraburkholderia steynii]SDI50568.1 maleylacetate reductase [Paraburkholderia steynii]
MQAFLYQSHATRVRFGNGVLEKLRSEIQTLGLKRVLVLTTPQQRPLGERIQALAGNLCVGMFSGAEMHVPVASVETACETARHLDADGYIAVGGGSTIGLAKAIALRLTMPIIAIPTTYAGSEMTSIFGITAAGRKTTGRDVRVLPKTVIYDPLLTTSLPLSVSVTSGINAIAHAAEGLYAQDSNPIIGLIAEEGIRAMGSGLPLTAHDPDDVDARAQCLYGAWLCGTVLGSAGMALHHKLCHTLGGSLNLPHGETHTIVLPHVLAYNGNAAPQAMERIARALGVEKAASGIYDLAKNLGAPMALNSIGMKVDDIQKVVDAALQNPYWNPRQIDRAPLQELIEAAFQGRRPS